MLGICDWRCLGIQNIASSQADVMAPVINYRTNKIGEIYPKYTNKKHLVWFKTITGSTLIGGIEFQAPTT
jgi:hypothetical protein